MSTQLKVDEDARAGLENVTVNLVDSVDSAAEFMRWLSTRKTVGCDIEGSGLNRQTDSVRLVQFGDQRTGWVIPFNRWAGVVDDAVRRYEGLYIFHNGPAYDCPMLERHGVKIPEHRVHDTRLMLHVLSSTESLALKQAAAAYVDPRAATSQQRLEEAIGRHGGWTWATVPETFGPYWQYAGLDTVLTHRLFDVIAPRVYADAPKSYELELAVAWVCARMERNGIYINQEYTRAYAEALTSYCQEVEAWCQSAYGVKPGSNHAVAARLMQDGIRLTKLTDAGVSAVAQGKPPIFSLDKEVLKEFAPHHPLAAGVLGRRQAEKLVSNYLGKILNLVGDDGLIHPSINTVGGTAKNPFESGGTGRGVRTGRMSISDPSVQNFPTRTKEGKKIRRAFKARDEHVWVKSDFDQIEARLLAHESGDREMIKAFTDEGDFFVNMARRIFDDPTIEKSDPRRQPVKNSMYAKIYSAGPEKFAITAGMYVTEERENVFGEIVPMNVPDVAGAAKFLGKLDEMYPGIRAFQRRIEREAVQRRNEEGVAYTRSSLTNRKHTADRGREYPLVNYKIQGTAGEIMKMKLVEADAAGLGPYMVFPVHDEVDLDVPRDRLDDVLVALHDVMNDAKLLNVPITASVSVGPNWGDVEDV